MVLPSQMSHAHTSIQEHSNVEVQGNFTVKRKCAVKLLTLIYLMSVYLVCYPYHCVMNYKGRERLQSKIKKGYKQYKSFVE